MTTLHQHAAASVSSWTQHDAPSPALPALAPQRFRNPAPRLQITARRMAGLVGYDCSRSALRCDAVSSTNFCTGDARVGQALSGAKTRPRTTANASPRKAEQAVSQALGLDPDFGVGRARLPQHRGHRQQSLAVLRRAVHNYLFSAVFPAVFPPLLCCIFRSFWLYLIIMPTKLEQLSESLKDWILSGPRTPSLLIEEENKKNKDDQRFMALFHDSYMYSLHPWRDMLCA